MSPKKKELLIHLKALKENGPTKVLMGICGNIPYDFYTERHLTNLMCSWPKYSGRDTYPIPDPKEESAYHAYHRTVLMWDRDDPYCQLRWELLDYCIAQLEIQLSKP